jgi:hypothetical protein
MPDLPGYAGMLLQLFQRLVAGGDEVLRDPFARFGTVSMTVLIKLPESLDFSPL